MRYSEEYETWQESVLAREEQRELSSKIRNAQQMLPAGYSIIDDKTLLEACDTARIYYGMNCQLGKRIMEIIKGEMK